MGYRIKVIVKNTKPPVWRQLLIPGGITFSQLGIIINEVYGLEHSEQFQFEFYQRKIQLEEEKEGKVFQPSFRYDLQEASNTYIDDYFETEDWCSYYTADAAFRVEIKEISEYDFNPIVMKSKGTFRNSILDCKQLTKVLYQKIRIVTDNDVHFDKMESMIKDEMIQLYRTENPMSADNNIRKSGSSMLQQFSDDIWKAMESRREQRDKQNLYLRDSLLGYSKSELKALAKEMHIRGYGSLTSSSLAEKIANELLSKNVMKKNFELCTDEEIEAFECAMAQKGEFSPTDKMWDELWKMYEKDYIAVYEDDTMEVPVDVREAYQKINTEEFHNIRKRKVWLRDCINMMDKIYIVAPVNILVQLYQKRKGYRLSKKVILQLFDDLPEDEKTCVLYDGKIISRDFYEDNHYKKMERAQGDKPFYIPTYEETMDYARNRYPSKEPIYQKLLDFFENELNYDTLDAKVIVIRIFQKVSLGCGIIDVLDSLEKWDIVFDSEDDFEKMANILVEINNNTRMAINRGNKPRELSDIELRKMRKSGRMPTIVPGSSHAAQMLMQGKNEIENMGFHLDFDSNADEIPVASISSDRKNIQTAVKKVYPNDLCPCGSGKKYKKCCGRE